jgi:hypothetical protein
MKFDLDDERVEVAADAVRSARLRGKKMAIKIRIQIGKIFKSLFLKKSCTSLKINY